MINFEDKLKNLGRVTATRSNDLVIFDFEEYQRLKQQKDTPNYK